jgi:hypothetical protein
MQVTQQDPGYASRILETGFVRLVAVAFLLLGVIFGLMQPAGSAGLGRAGAVLFWTVHGAAAVPCILLGTVALARMGLGRRLPPMGFVVASGLLGALLFSFLALGIEVVFGLEDGDSDGPGSSAGWAWMWLDEFGGVVPPFLLAWVLVNLPRLMRLGGREGPPATDEPRDEGDTPEPEGLLSRLPAALGTDVVLLSSDLHYLHVHTPRGRTMLLYNLADAEREMGGAGLRVHRSHWVAERHVMGIRRKSGGLVCKLTGGLEAPVSRRRQKEVLARFGRDTQYRPAAGEGAGR